MAMTDREKLIELLCNLPTPEFVIGTRRAGKKLITAGFIADHLIANGVTVQENTTADVAPVRHGRWKKQSGLYSCSECGMTCPYDVQADVIEYWACNYCPNCGAKMDGGVD